MIGARRRLLFVLTADFGELSAALYFTETQPFDVLMALPPRALSLNQSTLTVPTCEYRNVSDVFDAANRHRPDIVLLFSGYLFGANRIFDIEQLEQLLAGLRSRGCRLVTSDPFLGLMLKVGPSTISRAHPLHAGLIRHFAEVAQALRAITHLYPAAGPAAADHPSLSYFNPAVVRPVIRPVDTAATDGSPSGVDPNHKRWLFVLSAEDHAMQSSLRGSETFAASLVCRLRDTALAGRQAVVVAPQQCLERLAAAGLQDAPILLPFCSNRVFRDLSLDAEFTFYWNIFSHSIFERVANHLPVCFFDDGHLARAVPPLAERGKQVYYRGAKLPYIDATRELRLADLHAIAAEQAAAMVEVMSAYRALPAPNAVIEQVMES